MRTTIWRAPLQTLTFMRKEVTDALHQPRLLLTLVLGPFLIMAAFGLGYRNTPQPLKTIVVIADNSPLKPQLDTYTQQLNSYVKVVAVTSDATAASKRLQSGNVDVIVTFPTDPLHDVLNGQQAQVTIVHTRLDPIERTAISFASSLAVDQINGAVIAAIIGAGQQAAATPLDDTLGAASNAVTKLDTAVTSGDVATVHASLADLDTLTAAISTAARQTSGLFAKLGNGTSDATRAQQLVTQVDDAASTVTQLHQQGDHVDKTTVDHLTSSVATIRSDFHSLTVIDPRVLAQPFAANVQLAVPGAHRITDWYAPAAIVLILQQFGLAFGALTFVRERQLGFNEILRVAPVNAAPALIGKYMAYLLLGGAMGAALTALMVGTLHVPILGSIGGVSAVMALTLFASIGLGFVISMLSRTDAQAVQYALLVLLASLFFSGFFLSLGQMRGASQVITWLLPVSYGMDMLRDVMLRGNQPSPQRLIELAGYGLVMFALAFIGTHRQMNTTPA